MPDPSIERPDSTVLNHLIEIRKELSENTAETRGLKQEVRNLNGKVIGHETRLQSLESDKAVNAKLEEQREEKEKNNTGRWQRWLDKILWGALVIVLLMLYRVLVDTGFIKDFLK